MASGNGVGGAVSGLSYPQAPYAQTSSRAMFETPFLEVYEGGPRYEEPGPAEPGPLETPFVSEYLVGDEVVGGWSAELEDLLGELHDREFDESLVALVDEADARASLLGLDEDGTDPARVERALHQWLTPLRAEAETLLESMGEALAGADPQQLTDAEVDRLLERFEPSGAAEGPVFEDFLKKLWKKAKGAVKGAVKLAKKGIAAVGKVLPIGMILSKLKGLVRPLLTRVLKLALNKLPPALRPAAQKLAARLLGTRELAVEQSPEVAGTPASADVRALQEELDAEIASLLLAPEEPELEALVAEATFTAEQLDDGSLQELDRARTELVRRLTELEEGEDPTPLVEQFLPAVLPVLRMGMGAIGRPKVVALLAKLLGRLIAPLVGPQLTAPLSQAIVDAGLRLLTLEAGEDEQAAPDDRRVAAEAFAALVEDTAARVAELDEDELADEAVVEEVVLEGFRRASRQHFPPSVLKGASGRRSGVWVGMPRRGRRRYRKFTQIFDVTLTPEATALVRTRGGRTLATYLQDRFGSAGPVLARLHLYEAVPGTRLGHIARAERTVPGLGPATAEAHTELHPLTREAAGALLGSPELAREDFEDFLDELGPAAVGQRFYFLEVAGARPVVAPTPRRGTGRPRLSTTSAAVDLRRDEVRVAVFLSEARAQELAARLRRREPLGAVLGALRPVYAAGLKSLSAPSGRQRLRVLGVAPAELTSDEVLGETRQVRRAPARLPSGSPDPMGLLLTRWTRAALARQLVEQRQAVATAAAAPADGITLLVRLRGLPGLPAVVALARGSGGAPSAATWRQLLAARPAQTRLEVLPGYARA